jgi:hypothetical protein
VLRAAYDEVLATHDLLLMPTTPTKAQPMPQPGCSREESFARALEMTTSLPELRLLGREIKYFQRFALKLSAQDRASVSAE